MIEAPHGAICATLSKVTSLNVSAMPQRDPETTPCDVTRTIATSTHRPARTPRPRTVPRRSKSSATKL